MSAAQKSKKIEDLKNALILAQEYAFEAIKGGKDFVTRKGNGPYDHVFNLNKSIKYEMV